MRSKGEGRGERRKKKKSGIQRRKHADGIGVFYLSFSFENYIKVKAD